MPSATWPWCLLHAELKKAAQPCLVVEEVFIPICPVFHALHRGSAIMRDSVFYLSPPVKQYIDVSGFFC